METQFKILTTEALKLTPDEREAFVQLLSASLDQDAEVDDAWAAEVERRIADVESGVVQLVPLNDALVQIRAGLK